MPPAWAGALKNAVAAIIAAAVIVMLNRFMVSPSS